MHSPEVISALSGCQCLPEWRLMGVIVCPLDQKRYWLLMCYTELVAKYCAGAKWAQGLFWGTNLRWWDIRWEAAPEDVF
jgi:hypothetical protein